MEALRKTLPRLTESHRELLEAARRAACTCPEAIQNLGLALSLHQSMFDCLPVSARALLDERVVESLQAESETIAESLAHLTSLVRSEPGSPEGAALSAALLTRMRAHLERSERAVFRPLRRLFLEHETFTGDPNDPDA